MCGIAGLIGERNNEKAKIMIDKLSHRGPDGNQYWISPINEYPITICHTRLAILDLSESGNQPLVSKDGQYVLTFNGEIYNFLELRDELKSKGIIFNSNSDSEVLLEGLIYYGEDFQLRCNGMWAFCLWNRRTKEAILSRDRFGIKPLYYTLTNDNKLIFGSEMKSITPFLDSIQPSENIDDCINYLFNYESTDLCVIDGISRIRAGYMLKFKEGKISHKQYWNTLDFIEPNKKSYLQQVEQWKEIFMNSVEIRMRSDVPIGSALSGGLDSSCIVAAMDHIARNNNYDSFSDDWQHVFHSSFPGSSLDETYWAESLAKDLSLPLNKVIIKPEDFEISITKSLSIVEDPYLTLPLPMLMTYENIKKSGISVTLDGHGADELFIGYGHIKKAFACAKTKNEFAELIAIDESTRTGIYSYKEKKIKRKWAKYKLYELLYKKYKFIRSKIKYLLRKNDSDIDLSFAMGISEIEMHPRFKEMDIFNQVLYEIFHFTILPTLLRVYDRCSMANGVEIRMPFMDWRLVALSFSLPTSSKIGGSFTKRIQRDSLKKILMEPVRTRRSKIGWNTPSHEWFKKELKQNIENVLSSNIDSVYYPKALKAWKKFNNISAPKWNDGQKAWEAILPLAWNSSLSEDLWR